MKKLLFIIGLFIYQPHLYADTDHIYYGIGIGKNIYTELPNYQDGSTILLNIEKPLLSVGKGVLSINAEFSHTLEPVKVDPDIAFHEITISTLGIYANYEYPLNSDFYAKVKLGIVDVDYHWDYGTGHTHDRNENKLHFAKGLAIGYNLTSSLRLNMDYIFQDSSDLKAWNLSIQKSF